MSDRLDLEEYKERIAECEDDWLGVCPSEFIERCADLVAEVESLRPNQVHGRCGECGWYRDMICTKHSHWENQVEKEPNGFCDEFKPKWNDD